MARVARRTEDRRRSAHVKSTATIPSFSGGSKMKHQEEREADLTGSRRRNQSSRKPMPRLTLRIDFDGARAVGPGKIKLMEMIDRHGSISEAGRQMGMSYRRAWLLVDSLNRCFRAPVVAGQRGGLQGGGASLTKIGHAVVHHYRAVGKTTLDASWNTAAASRPFSATTGCREPVKGRRQRGAARAPSLGSLQWFFRRCDRSADARLCTASVESSRVAAGKNASHASQDHVRKSERMNKSRLG
jgi:molybdate transport system regulatory protein